MSLPSPSAARVVAAVLAVGEPCALAGLTLAAMRSWGDFVVPSRPDLVVPASRRDVYSEVATLRRVVRWEEVELTTGPLGLPAVGILDGVITLAPATDDATLHTIVQQLAYAGDLDVNALMGRRRTGLPGSARLTRVGGRYLVGLDSPRELEVFNVLRSRGLAPDHLNVSVAHPDGRTVGPFDGYADVGAAYEVDSIHHTSDHQLAVDGWKTGIAVDLGLAVVRFIGKDIDDRLPMLEGWVAAREVAAARAAGLSLQVVHPPDRRCICGYGAAEVVDDGSKIIR